MSASPDSRKNVYRIVAVTRPARQAFFTRAFSEKGYRWAFAANEGAAADEVMRSATDLLLVDAVALADDAQAIVAAVKRIGGLKDLPVIAIIDADAIAAAPEIWWDDFLLEPMRAGELALRISLIFSRKRGGPIDIVSVGPVTIDYEAYEVTRNGRRMSLTYKEHELLRFLAGHPNKPFTREAILERVWGGDYIGGVRTVDVHVRRLRAKIGDLRGRTIETVRGVGYRFRKAARGE
jgi:DNA-binding response OmpR family regulator